MTDESVTVTDPAPPSIVQNATLLWCAIKLESGAVSEDVIDNYMEPENRDILHALLPGHLRACGPIVSVEPLFDVFIVCGDGGI